MTYSRPHLAAWQPLGTPPPDTLTDARLQLHHAVQVVAAVGYTFLPHAADWSEVSVHWDDAAGALVGGMVTGSPPYCAALRLPDLTLQLRDAAGHPLRSFALDGYTLEDGYAWLAGAIAGITEAPAERLVRPDHRLPDHPVFSGGAFSLADAAAFAELTRWYANAHRLLQPLAATEARASPVRCWPHHFDLATLITLDPDLDPEEARAIGVGLSPGDTSYPFPYWYLTPYPAPAAAALPPLPEPAAWHTAGWTGAILTGPALVQAGPAQAEVTSRYLQTALAAAHRLLAHPPD